MGSAYLLSKDWDLLNPYFIIAEWQMRVRDNEKVVEELEICECKLESLGRRVQGLRDCRCQNGHRTGPIIGASLDVLIFFGWILAFQLLDGTILTTWTRFLTLQRSLATRRLEESGRVLGG